MNPKIDKLLQILLDKGLTTEEMANLRNELLEGAYEAFMKDALQFLTDDDLKTIEASATQVEANAALKRIYAEKTGKNSQDEMKRIVDEKADAFIEKYTSESAVQSPGAGIQADEAGIVRATDELHTISGQTAADTEPDPVKASNPQNWQ